MEEAYVEFLQREHNRVIRLGKYACVNNVYDEAELADKALELFFITPQRAKVIAQMCLARLKVKQELIV